VAGRWRPAHGLYVRHVLPRLARAVTGTQDAYAYLAESVGDWPGPHALAGRIAAAGWQSVGWRQLMLGAVAMHTATR
jgi:demethylmenaquinone methyltransferase/2-methoxy-6-polyprenyl-1,4-benzoquinol methylase